MKINIDRNKCIDVKAIQQYFFKHKTLSQRAKNMTNSWNFATGDQVGPTRNAFGGTITPFERGDLFAKDENFQGALSWLNALKIYQGGPVSRILDAQNNFYMIERVQPSTTSTQILELVESGQDDRATRIQALLATQLHDQVPHDFDRSQFVTADQYFQPVRDKLALGIVPPDLVKAFTLAVQIHDDLSTSHAHDHTVLHYHIHYQRAIIADNGAVTIEPTGVIGHPAREAAAWLYNPNGVKINDGYDGAYTNPRFVEVPFVPGRLVKQAKETSDITGWDNELILKYTFIRCVENAARRLDGTPQGQVPLDYWRPMINLAARTLGLDVY
jgi:streptomycin 6-kinase